ncbi:MAG TPA: murein L,D-transpeptidase catalytic domain family protein [Gemmatimonadaceae bacterium]|nr:murein L,D-transpeptidase catalytic domain family protein [Gemmatimonadaceae bacterium]
MIQRKYLGNVLIGGAALLFGGAQVTPGARTNSPLVSSAISVVTGGLVRTDTSRTIPEVTAPVAPAPSKLATALGAFQNVVRPLSDSRALTDAFKSYFAYKSAHPEQVRKPYLYFVDYGLPATTPRGYVFDMESMKVLDGPFMVAHGRGSAANGQGIPTRFSNAFGSYATSLGLYIAQETYAFHGKSGGRTYGSIGLKLQGVSEGFNDNARARKVVAHGAPYVTPTKAGRSEGCPAMEPARAQKLLPVLANGAMVFLFAPDQQWLQRDPWVTASAE